MLQTPIDFIIATYVHSEEANQARQRLKPHDDKIIDLALVSKDKDGNMIYQDRDDLDPQQGKNIGALVGGLVGLSFGPGGLLGAAVGTGLGIAAGALTGGTIAKSIDTGIDDETIEQAMLSLKPGMSALLVVAPEDIADDIADELHAPHADIQRYDLNIAFTEKQKRDAKEKGKTDEA